MSALKSFGRIASSGILDEAIRNVPDAEGCLAIFTDEVRWLSAEDLLEVMDERRIAHLLELRLYNADAEFHALRTTLVADFVARLRTDGLSSKEDSEGFWRDEEQCLDIASSDGYSYKSTTGGWYSLPVAHAKTVTLRNYYEFDANGVARFVDFRIVSLNTWTDGEGDAEVR